MKLRRDVVFGGLSGVVFGLFGYVWMRSRGDSETGFRMPTSLIVLVLGWFVIGLLLFKTGDPVSRRVIDETERLIRGNAKVYDVSIRPIRYEKVKIVFRRLLAAVGIDRRAGGPRPRLHCFRHTLAVRALEGCLDPRLVAKHQLALSTYLGHSSIASTSWYLEATPDLLAKISRGSEGFVEGYAR